MSQASSAERSVLAYRRGIGTEILLSESFDRSRVTPLRHSIAACAEAAGLTGARLDDFVVAVNELLTNAVRHGGGSGRVAMWTDRGAIVCEVSDRGAGLDVPLSHRERPAADQPGGWGLWLAEELTDEFTVETGPEGTSVRISSRAVLRDF
jgi:serine/threonine-protein kinase RsbW